MREAYLELQLRHAVKIRGGIFQKLTASGTRGVPDRMVIIKRQLVIPGDGPGMALYGETLVFFIEMKAPGGTVSPLQDRYLDKLRELGANVQVIGNLEQLNSFVNYLDRYVAKART